MPETEPGRLAAHVLLDAVVAQQLGDDAGASNLALRRLTETGAVTTTIDPATDTATVNADHLIGGCLTVLAVLIKWVAEDNQTSQETVVARLREIVDQHLG